MITTFFTYNQADTLIFYISLVLAYIVVVMLAHYFKAWVALQLGDSTAAESGFLSLNPTDHTDPIGFMCLFLFGLGWGRNVPINALNIHGRYRSAKIMLAYLSDGIAYLGIGIACMLLLGILFDGVMIPQSVGLIKHNMVSYQALHSLYPDYSSCIIAIGFIALCAMYLTIMLGALQLVIDFFHLCLHTYAGHAAVMSGFGEVLFIVVPVIAMLFLTGPLRLFMLHSMGLISMGIARLVGLL